MTFVPDKIIDELERTFGDNVSNVEASTIVQGTDYEGLIDFSTTYLFKLKCLVNEKEWEFRIPLPIALYEDTYIDLWHEIILPEIKKAYFTGKQ